MAEENSKQNSNSKSLGKQGEELAEKFITNLGYKIVKRNFRFGKGEIDIIAKDGDVLVFIEVKTRKNLDLGPIEYSITKSKIAQLKKIAEAYYYINEIENQECRFDVITILAPPNQKPIINHLINAFI